MKPARSVVEGIDNRQWWLVALLLSAFTLALLASMHVGFQASDDASYLGGALGWIESFPFVGSSHWTLRHTITLPAALLVCAFGLNEVAVSLTNILYFLAFLVVNAWFMARHLGRRVAVVATMLVIVLPGFTVVATYLNPDIPELFFVSTAFWLIASARDDPATKMAWLAVGFLLGAAFITRQTALAALIFVAALFVLSPRVPRSRYLLAAVAFVLVVSADWLYLTLMTGNPIYRFSVDFNHDRVDRFAEAARVAATGGFLDKEGNFSVNVFLDPFLALFVSQKYALLFWLLIPACLLMWRRRAPASSAPLLLLCGLAATYFAFVALNPKLYLVPRYLVIVAWCASVIVAWWLVKLWSESNRATATTMLALSIATGLLALSVENTNPRFLERTLLKWAMVNPGQRIHTDPETAVRSQYFFRFAGESMEHVVIDKPAAGATVLYSKDRMSECAVLPRCRDRAGDFVPTAQWSLVKSFEAGPRPLGRLIRAAGLDRFLPADIARRVLAPGGRASVYFVEQRR